MTSPCPSPTRFQGLPWETWTNALGRTAPIEDKPPELPKPTEKNKAGLMKLPKDDMKIFGLCPERDPFTVVICEKCNMCVKPQALLHHFEMRHSNNEGHPPQVFTELVVPEKTPTKVVKTIVKNTATKLKTKKNSNKETSKSKEGVVNPPHSLPVSLAIESPIANPGTSKGETLQPVVALTPLAGASGPVSPAAPVLSKPPAPVPAPAAAPPVLKARRPPRKHAPIKEREYDPDKHCGVVSTETLKPCTWSLTCKSHPMSLRRAVTGRSKPFDQLLADHRQAKEALLKQKKTLEAQNSAILTTTTTTTTQVLSSEPKRVAEQREIFEKPIGMETMNSLLLRLPELNLEMTTSKRIYLSAAHPSLVMKGSERPSSPLLPVPVQADVVAFTLNYPKSLSVSPMFSSHKIGGLVYTNRRMQIARQGLESCLNRAGNGYRDLCTGLPISGMPSTLSNVLNNMSSRAVKGVKRKIDKPNKSNKKVCLSKELSPSLLNIPINGFKSVLSRQYPNTPSRLSVPSSANAQFHIPNILSNALKRSDSPPKTQNKKLKKNSAICSVLSNHSKNGLVANKSTVPYVRVAISSGKVDPDSKTLGLCESPKFANSTKLLNESDLRKMGLRYEIYE